VITNDLDLAILAATKGQTPSVLQIRTQDLLTHAAMNFGTKAIEAFRPDIEAGALLSIDESGTR
jgi:predicted nuclease of predicted toxin-antitoxin system